jgi:hypothetical protein
VRTDDCGGVDDCVLVDGKEIKLKVEGCRTFDVGTGEMVLMNNGRGFTGEVLLVRCLVGHLVKKCGTNCVQKKNDRVKALYCCPATKAKFSASVKCF